MAQQYSSRMPSVDPLRITKRQPTLPPTAADRSVAQDQRFPASRSHQRGEGTRNHPAQHRAQTSESSDDDDVPLARAIPTALQAQKTLRVASRARALSTSSPGAARRARASEREPSVPRPNPSQGSSPPSQAGPAPPDELSRRLQALQAPSSSSKVSTQLQPDLSLSSSGVPRRQPTQSRSRRDESPAAPVPRSRPSLDAPAAAYHERRSGESPYSSSQATTPSRSQPSHSPHQQRRNGERTVFPSSFDTPSAAAATTPSYSPYTHTGEDVNDATIRPRMRARAMTLNASSSSHTPPPKPKSRPPSWIDFPEPDFSKPSSSSPPKRAAEPTVAQAPPQRRQPTRSQTSTTSAGLTRTSTSSRSRPSSPTRRPSVPTIQVPLPHALQHNPSSGSLPPPYSTSPKPQLPPLPVPAAADRTSPVNGQRSVSTSAAALTPNSLFSRVDMDSLVKSTNEFIPSLDPEYRIFIESKQKYVKVKIGAQMRARDVIARVAMTPQGSYLAKSPNADSRAVGGWMLFEVATDFGMERPVREYELIADVFNTWPGGNAEADPEEGAGARVNYLMIKRTGLRGVLAQKHIPTSSPIHEGVVQFEAKKGKWSKRHLRLREHSLFVAKKDSGKDETHLCSMSNFDGYYVTKVHRAPKTFVFAVRSTDNLNMFENPSDSVHIFSCDPVEGEMWVEKLLLARSYVLSQERQALFVSPTSTSTAPLDIPLAIPIPRSSRPSTSSDSAPYAPPLVSLSGSGPGSGASSSRSPGTISATGGPNRAGTVRRGGSGRPSTSSGVDGRDRDRERDRERERGRDASKPPTAGTRAISRPRTSSSAGAGGGGGAPPYPSTGPGNASLGLSRTASRPGTGHGTSAGTISRATSTRRRGPGVPVGGPLITLGDTPFQEGSLLAGLGAGAGNMN